MIELRTKLNEKPIRPTNMQHITNMLDIFQEFYLISSGIQLGLFDYLAKKKLKAEEIAAALNFEKDLIQVWCEAAIACGYLEKDGDKVSLSRWSKYYLVSNSPSFIGYLSKYTTIIPEAFSAIEARFRGNRPLMETQHALTTVESIAPIAKLATPLLMQEVPILREKCHILDVGCGLGSYLINFARSNPDLTGIGVDGGWIAAIVYKARENVTKYNLQNRIKIVLADIMELELNQKFDIIFMSGFLQAFTPQNALLILKKAHSWLKSGGTLILQEMLLDEDRIGPKSNALLNLLLHLETPEAGLFTFKQLKDLLTEAKFSEIRRLDALPQITHIFAY